MVSSTTASPSFPHGLTASPTLAHAHAEQSGRRKAENRGWRRRSRSDFRAHPSAPSLPAGFRPPSLTSDLRPLPLRVVDLRPPSRRRAHRRTPPWSKTEAAADAQGCSKVPTLVLVKLTYLKQILMLLLTVLARKRTKVQRHGHTSQFRMMIRIMLTEQVFIPEFVLSSSACACIGQVFVPEFLHVV
ncbi:uncharacterized protein LOC119283404 [Triticum dicoccoides]|uniref:uncharacterized protein LOC119283404 n=1 Tax=Triticum dicoccoides TaxID=85692 RepID=UPI0018907DC9|nr:uncharacterized protein LOC119283404 [Triticum dicoccoides]